MQLTDRAQGRWPEIITALIGDEYTNTRKHMKCPKDQSGTDRFRFSDKDGKGRYFCACSDGKNDGLDLIQCVKGCDLKGAITMVEEVIGKSEMEPKPRRAETYGERLLRTSETLQRSRYLESRGLEMAPGLRWHREVEYRDENGVVTGTYAGMLAPLYRGDKLLTCQVTYLDKGKKADVPVKKKTMPVPANATINGASVALYPASETLGIGEGVETCIAAKMLHDVPVWAALTANGLESWEPPEVAKHILIFGDFDSNWIGHAAAYKLASRLVRAGRTVEVMFPPKVDTDWADLLLEMRPLK
ncbi:toprim domain-containing protein [Sphingomonas sp.]|jgi:putative DNA primase/helicase|uniref:toprim domain-containing protein n=1 Tax=Sphingomonas sp. TaxID=28214 RepID=UPI0035695026